VNTIFVAWQDPETRDWKTVGRLNRDHEFFRFAYTEGAKDSKNFKPFGRMNELDAVYKSDKLFPLFANRILPKSRPEYLDYMRWLGLNAENHDVMEELSRSAGLRATDSLEMFPYPEPVGENNYEIHFFSRGLSHMYKDNQDRARTLCQGESLYLMGDLQNPHDKMALLMRTNDPVSLIGYLPRYYSAEVCQLIKSNGVENVKVEVEQVNVNAPIQYRVMCKLTSKWPVNFSPFSDKQFQPLAEITSQ